MGNDYYMSRRGYETLKQLFSPGAVPPYKEFQKVAEIKDEGERMSVLEGLWEKMVKADKKWKRKYPCRVRVVV